MASEVAAAAGHPAEVAAAMAILERGGNSVDAAIAGAFCAAVVEPNNAGLAGYGHLASWDPARGTFLSVDHGPQAPAAATATMFAVEEGDPDPLAPFDSPAVAGDANSTGGLASATPGMVRGLCDAHAAAGRLPLADVLAPAIELASGGFAVDWPFALVATAEFARLQANPAAAAWALADGCPPRGFDHWGEGSRLDASAIADVLERVARQGADGFHDGPIAEAFCASLAEHGGIIALDDLRAFRPAISEEAPCAFAGRRLAVGDDDLSHLLFNMLDRLALPTGDPLGVEHAHLMAEAFGHAFADGVTWSGDPAATPELSRVLRSADYADARAAAIDRRAAARPIAPGALGDVAPATGGTSGTTQVVARDADGGMTVVITTIGRDFGSGVFVPALGGFGNSAMGNFDPRPGRANSIAPGKRPLFGVPTAIAVDDAGRAVAGCGGSGGWAITSSVTHSLVNALLHGCSAAEAVALPRVWCEGGATYVDDRFPDDVLDGLRERGHAVVPRTLTPASEPFARVSLVVAGDGIVEAASDPGWHGAARVG